jgi:hypothetical protein
MAGKLLICGRLACVLTPVLSPCDSTSLDTLRQQIHSPDLRVRIQALGNIAEFKSLYGDPRTQTLVVNALNRETDSPNWEQRAESELHQQCLLRSVVRNS